MNWTTTLGVRILAIALLYLAALAATFYWWQLGRPVEIVDAPADRMACVSYAPFRIAGETPFNPDIVMPPERIEEDLRALSRHFDCVRTYSVSQGLAEVPRIARGLGMQVLMGVWLGRDAVDNEKEIQLAIATARRDPRAVRAVIVGNEVLLRGELPPAKLAEHIRRVHDETKLPVTYADVWEFWLRYRASIQDAVSFVTIHILPYWEDDPVAVEQAVVHVRDIHALVARQFPGKDLLIGETGWPSAGRQREGAIPSQVNQARFVREFLVFARESQVDYNLIEAFDQPWKRILEGTVGGYWGIYDASLHEKFPLMGPVTEEPQWRDGLYAGLGMAVLFILIGSAGVRPRAWGTAAMLLGGYVSGALLMAQWRHMLFANRNLWEWGLVGGFTILAFLTGLLLTRMVARRLDGRAQPQGALPGYLRLAWLFAGAVVCLLLVFDARYRAFPSLLFCIPILGWTLAALIGLERPRAGIEEKILAGWIALAACLIVGLEGWQNQSALIWSALCLLFSASVLWPSRNGRAA